MKNILIAVVALIGLCPSARAQIASNTTPVSILVHYKTTCSSVTINIAATEMTGNTAVASTTAGISALKVSNLSSSASVCCSSANTVVCTVGSSFYVEPIFPSSAQPNFDEWGIAVTQPWYCAASSSNTSVSSCLVH